EILLSSLHRHRIGGLLGRNPNRHRAFHRRGGYTTVRLASAGPFRRLHSSKGPEIAQAGLPVAGGRGRPSPELVGTRAMTRPALTILLAAPRGFCAGVDRAIQIVEKSIAAYGAPVYVRHEIVH